MSIGWMAGFFDGEGSIGVYRDSRYGTFFLSVEVCNTKRELMRDINRVYGGLLVERKSRNNQNLYRIIWRGKSAYQFLKKVEPEVRGKQKELKLALQFYDKFFGGNLSRHGRTTIFKNGKFNGTTKTPKKIIEEKIRFITALKKLKIDRQHD